MSILYKLPDFRFIFIPKLRSYSKSTQDNLINLLITMPKDPKHISEAQKQRRKIKEKLSRYVPGKVTLQVLGTGAKGAPRSLYLFSDQSRYLFNCGEGTQRLAHEHKMKLAKLEHIFITQPTWKNIGGLPGTALTIQDVGVPEITLHGPPGLDEIFVATKRFVIIKDLKIRMAGCEDNSTFEDNVLSVKYVSINRVCTKKNINSEESAEEMSNSIENTSEKENCNRFSDLAVEATVDQLDAATSTRSNKRNRRRSSSRKRSSDEVIDDTDYYAHEHSGSRTSPGMTSSDMQNVLREMKEKGTSMVYICRLHPRPGALNLEKCVAHGIPPGPLLGKLKAGESVTLENGNIVTTKDVCEPDDPGPLFIVVDCPTTEYLDSLINNNSIKQHQKSAKCDEDVACLVVHFTPKEIVENPRYKQWMDDFTPSTQHLIMNEMNTCMGSQAVHRIQYKLNLLSQELFPILGDKGTEIINEALDTHVNKKMKCDNQIENETDSTNKTLNLENLSVDSRPTSPSQLYIFPNTFCSYHLRPKKGLDRTVEIKLNPDEYISETIELNNFSSILQKLKIDLHQQRMRMVIEEYPKILFLGTGSCIPNKTRNTSGILLTISDNNNIVLDCGEGTYGQIIRFFGKDKADRVLANISAVYISHLHADHHIGLIGLLQGRRRALDALDIDRVPFYLFAPKQILAWLNFYDQCFENIVDDFILIPNGELIYDNTIYPEVDRLAILNTLQMKDIKTCLVRHCPNAFGVSLMTSNGLKITYSGDTMPSERLKELGTNSDLLIHEATMEDELAQEAIVKMHCTTSQAIEIGKQMNARNILLTHFSQRYAKLPRFNDNFTENVGIAFDNMQVRLDELPLVPTLYPALKIMFAEHYEELEHKAVKRQLKLERERSVSRERYLKQVVK